jgi:hypothetical protein
MRWYGAAMAALVLGAAGCSSDSMEPDQSPMTQAEAQGVADDLEASIANVAGTSTLPDVTNLNPAQAGYFGPADFQPHANCPTITPFPPTDTDGDHVPDIVTFSFTLPDCSFTGSHGTTLELTGSVTISDPSATAAGLRAEFADLQRKVTLQNGDFFLQRLDGVRQILADAAGFAAVDSLTAVSEFPRRGQASLENTWTVDFVVDAGGTFEPHTALPSGTFDVEGGTVRSRHGVSRSLDVTTVTPLHFNASCTEHQKIDSGEIHAEFVGPRGTATVTLVYTACGVRPTMTLVTVPAA